WKAYYQALKQFDEFTNVQAFIGLSKKKQEATIYRLLDDFIGYLDKQNYAPKTIQLFYTAARSYLKYLGVKISVEESKDKVKLPKLYIKNRDRAPAIEELYEVVSKAELRAQTITLMLASSGMRRGEIISLRIEDIDFSEVPFLIKIQAEKAKERQYREVFISKEAGEYLSRFLNGRKEGYVFHGFKLKDGRNFIGAKGGEYIADYERPISVSTIDELLRTAFRKAGLTKKMETRYEIHIHTLRKFFYSQMVGKITDRYVHALMGHSMYLGEYLSLSTEKKREIYLQGMDSVTIMSKMRDLVSLRTKLEEETAMKIQDAINTMQAQRRDETKDIVKQLLVAFGFTSNTAYDEYVTDLRQELGREPSTQEIIDRAKEEKEGLEDSAKLAMAGIA
ncbi:MAG: tyrosine-type recombinase/integrase, partial [Nitrosopumilaceae archaeon]